MSENMPAGAGLTIDGLMQSLGQGPEGGWRELDELMSRQAGSTPQPEQVGRMAEIAEGLFSTGTGREFLEYLMDLTVRQYTWSSEQLAMSREAAMDFTIMRNGQNSVVAHIVNLMASAEVQQTEETDHG